MGCIRCILEMTIFEDQSIRRGIVTVTLRATQGLVIKSTRCPSILHTSQDAIQMSQHLTYIDKMSNGLHTIILWPHDVEILSQGCPSVSIWYFYDEVLIVKMVQCSKNYNSTSKVPDAPYDAKKSAKTSLISICTMLLITVRHLQKRTLYGRLI